MIFQPAHRRLAAALLIASAAFASSSFAAEPARTMPASAPAPSTGAKTHVHGQGAALDVGFAYDADKQALRVNYQLRNVGGAALAVFDRGDRHAVAGGRQKLGAIAPPAWKDDGGDVTLSHIALPLANPAPTAPVRSLALKLAPGGESSGQFAFAVPGLQAPKRLRWCLGVAAFADTDFDTPERVGALEIWRASFAVSERQQVLCTPWFDVARGAFEA
ncbi:hypothetical protein [Pseudomonas sp. CGJS7]|uniref:hypothetical protein n=1 Tax=Pseudomonas sp. CGJS7 TaxID=3109348 RepID=UPI00300A4816